MSSSSVLVAAGGAYAFKKLRSNEHPDPEQLPGPDLRAEAGAAKPAAEKVGDKLADAKDKASDALDTAKDKAADVADTVKDKAVRRAGQGQGRRRHRARTRRPTRWTTAKDKAADAGDKVKDAADKAKDAAGSTRWIPRRTKADDAGDDLKDAADKAKDASANAVDAAKKGRWRLVTLAPEGRKLLRLEVRNAAVPIEKKPDWIKTKLRTGPEFQKLQSLVKTEGLHTVCQEAGCPNIYECWEDREATFLIGGDQCTRRCDFCLIDTGKPGELDRDEPRRVAESIRTMDLRYATITGVTRDDLPDEGAWLYAETVRQVHAQAPATGVEILTPDFSGRPELLRPGLRRRTRGVRAQPGDGAADLPADPSGVHLREVAGRHRAGQGGRDGDQVQPDPRDGRDPRRDRQALVDMHSAGCDLVTITQYLRPTPRHHPVERWVKPQEFVELSDEAKQIGFAGVMSGPLVRSSYRAGTLYRQGAEARAARGGRRSTRGTAGHRVARTADPCGPRHPIRVDAARCAFRRIATSAATRPPRRPRALSWTAWPRMPPVLAPPPKLLRRTRRRRRRRPSGSPAKERRSQIWQAFQMQRKQDKKLLPLMIGALVGTAAVVTLALMWFLPWWMVLPFGIVLGAMLAMIIFSRRVQANVYKQAEGTPGAAAWSLQNNLRGKWRITPAIAGTSHMDAVHRVDRPARASSWSARAHRTGSSRCWRRRRRRSPGWSATPRSMTSSSATKRARPRCAS